MFQLHHTCDISRNAAVGTNGRKQLQAFATSVACLAIPMNAPTSIQNGFELGRAYDFYFHSGQDVKVGDKLTWSGDTYVVQSVQKYILPLVEHIHVMAQQEVN
jgi:hypothetical protein